MSFPSCQKPKILTDLFSNFRKSQKCSVWEVVLTFVWKFWLSRHFYRTLYIDHRLVIQFWDFFLRFLRFLTSKIVSDRFLAPQISNQNAISWFFYFLANQEVSLALFAKGSLILTFYRINTESGIFDPTVVKWSKTKNLQKMGCKSPLDKCPHHIESARRALSDYG